MYLLLLLFSHMDGRGSRRSRVERGGRLLMGVSCCDPLTSPKSFSIFWPFFFHYFTFTWVILTLKADNTSNQLKRECCTLFKSALFLTPMIFGKTKGWFQFWAWSSAPYNPHYKHIMLHFYNWYWNNLSPSSKQTHFFHNVHCPLYADK